MESRFQTFNSEVIKDVLKYNEEIEAEKQKENPDAKELEKLYWQQLYRGMQINGGYTKNYGYRPY